MPFRGTPFHNEVAAYLRKILRELGLNPLRADDKIYSDDVMANIEAYIYGCRFAVAVHASQCKCGNGGWLLYGYEEACVFVEGADCRGAAV